MPQKDIFYIKIADLCIEMRAVYPYSRKKCRDYLCECVGSPDIVAEVDEKEIEAEIAAGNGAFSPDYCENICLYRAIAEKLPLFDRFVFHGAAISDGERGFIFTAPSGTGKSTHIGLWKESFGDSVEVINGDKPIISLVGGVPVVFGTPWAGKEGWHSNISREVSGICLLFRCERNLIRSISPADYFNMIIKQLYIPCDSEARLKTLDLISALAESTKFYRLDCNISREAASVARAGMVSDETADN